MLARSAERNPSVFAPELAGTVETVIPQLLNISEYTDNAWGNTKFLLMQFKPSPAPISSLSKAERKHVQEAITQSKSLEMIAEAMNIELGKGGEFIAELEKRLKGRGEPAAAVEQVANGEKAVRDDNEIAQDREEAAQVVKAAA